MNDYIKRRAREAAESFYAHVRPEMRALAERPQKLTWAEYKDIRANSYERRLLHQNLDDEALCTLYDLCEKNAGRQPIGRLELADHYDHAIQCELAPLLVARLRARKDTSPHPGHDCTCNNPGECCACPCHKND